jgi:amino acid permease
LDCDNIDISEEKENKKSILGYKEKTSILFKILFIIGLVFIIISAILMLLSSEENKYNALSQTFLALSIIIFAFSGIIYFFKRQFAKLANIADEIEKSVYDDEECFKEDSIEKL